MKYVNAHNSFSSGKLSKKLRSRWDTKEYPKGCEELKNMFPMKTGGVVRRVGAFDYPLITKYLIENATGGYSHSYYPAVIVPFVFSKTESYLVVFYKSTISSTFDNYAVFDATTHEPQTVGGFTAGSIPIPTDSYTTVVQVGDVLMVYNYADSSIPQFVIVRSSIPNTGEIEFNIQEYHDWVNGFYNDFRYEFLGVTYRDANVDTGIKFTSSATGGADGKLFTGTVSVTTITSSSAFFDPGHVGAFFRITDAVSEREGVIRIDAWVSTTSVTGTILVNFGPDVVASGSICLR